MGRPYRHVMLYQRNIMGIRRYIIRYLCPNLVSFPFYVIPIFPFTFPKFFIYLSPVIFFLDLGTFISVYLVTNVHCRLRISSTDNSVCLKSYLLYVTASTYVYHHTHLVIRYCLPEAICCYITRFTLFVPQKP